MDSQVITPNSDNLENQYKIKTKNLSFQLSPRYDQLNCFCWHQIPNKSRYILRNVSFEAKPGEIIAIAGPSGAGKTTLLDILAGMVGLSRVSGHVLVNDQPMNAAHFRKISGYVTQEEALFPLLTVKETLAYSARLRLPGGREKAVARVKSLLTELGLDHVADVKIGSESSRKISGGEKRRVSIGVDLVHDPAVLLIDEPTSGLDSASALHVMSLLKSMAKNQGKTILLTIHQPSFRILELIDRVVLLSNGFVIHNGPLYLLEARLNHAGHLVPLHVNVLEFAIDVTESLQMESDSDIELCKIEQEQDHYQMSSFANLSNARIFYSNTPIKEVLILSQRFCSNIFRTKQLFAARTIQALLVGIVLGTIFMNANDHNSEGLKLQTQLGFFAFSLTFLLSSTTEALPIFLQERRILMRETSRGAYRISSYIISNTLVFIPFLLIVALLYTTPVYWLVGLRRDIDGYLYFSLVVWMVLLMSNSFVACFSALVPNFIMGMSVIAGLMGAFFLFSGYFIAKDDVPKYWIFVHYLSLFKYPFECLMINEFGGKEGGKWRCLERDEGECLLYGDQFLKHQGLKETQKWSHLIVMLGFIIGYRVVCFMILWYRSYRNRS